MQELIINDLLTIVILTAVVLRFLIGTRADSGMTKKQKTMLTRILIAAAMLLGLQFLQQRPFPKWMRIYSPPQGALCVSHCIWWTISSSATIF